MTLYLFGFVECGPGGVDLPDGVLGRPTIVPLDAVAGAVVAEVPADRWADASVDETASAALHHDAVLRSCLDLNVVPVRFGTSLADAGALGDVAAAHGPALVTIFERFRGRHEYDVRLRADRPVAATGRDYLLGRRAEIDGSGPADRLVDSILDAVAACRPGPQRHGERRLAVIADEHEIAAVRSIVAASPLDGEVRGPLPPYSFVRLDDGGTPGA